MSNLSEMTVEEASKQENNTNCYYQRYFTRKGSRRQYTNYTDAEKTMQIFDKFKLGYKPNTETAMDYTGIIIPFNTKDRTRSYCSSLSRTTTGITNITTDEAAKNAPVYNLVYQKVTKAYKGCSHQERKEDDSSNQIQNNISLLLPPIFIYRGVLLGIT